MPPSENPTTPRLKSSYGHIYEYRYSGVKVLGNLENKKIMKTRRKSGSCAFQLVRESRYSQFDTFQS